LPKQEKAEVVARGVTRAARRVAALFFAPQGEEKGGEKGGDIEEQARGSGPAGRIIGGARVWID